jgi:hypothetical protein
MTLLIIIIAGVFVYFMFNNDRNEQKSKVIQRGGLRRIYPNFIGYIELANSGEYTHDLSLDETRFE